MKKSLHQNLIQAIRQKTPLGMRHRIGPVVSYLIYKFNIYVRPNRKRPKVLSIEETIDTILKEKCSVIRYGDGEISLIDGTPIGFQNRTNELAMRLESIIQVKDPRLLICIPGFWEELEIFEGYAYWFNMHHLYRYGHIWKKLLSYDRVYGDTSMTRLYLAYKDKALAEYLFKKLFSIWEGKEVVLIEGAKSRLGVGNDMFKSTRSLGRILCPPENAYEKYEIIKTESLKTSKEKLILLSLGPTAKVLAYDLFQLGYRVIDIGHIDMEYEMFLRKQSKQTKVPYKYFNEINERNPEDCHDNKYLSQIIATIK